MKKLKLTALFIFVVAVISLMFAFAACSKEYTVTFDSDGGSNVVLQKVTYGETAAEPDEPTKYGYAFLGWFNGENKYSFDNAVTGNLTLVAKWQALDTFTVTFNSDGGSAVESQIVVDGEKATKPADPTRDGYNFTDWFNGAFKYDFNTPVTKDITLIAEWDEKQYAVEFDTDGGNVINPVNVVYKATVSRPDDPIRDGFYFEGWYIGDVKYDFATPVTSAITIKAKWSSVSSVKSAFTAALTADYSNFTSAMTVSEEDVSYTNTFKQSATLAYYSSESALYEDHLVVFSDRGDMLAMYYLHNGIWAKSNLITYADFVVALYLDEISFADVEYSEGVYHVKSASIDSVVYALFRSTDYYSDLDIIISDGHIAEVRGVLDEMTHVQTFYDFGKTSIIMPSIPAVSVSVETKNRELEAGKAINIDELINYMFAVKAEGKPYKITKDMVSLDGLDLAVPVEGEYRLTITFDTWDGVTHTKTATLSVKTVQEEETFAEIFAKDYSNVTVTSGTTTFKHTDNVYTSSGVKNAYYFVENDGSLTKYVVSDETCNVAPDNWFVLPRLEILFLLNAELFEQVESSNTYVAKNVEAIADVLNKTVLTTKMQVNTLRDYSITLTVELGRVTKIAYSYYYLAKTTTATSSNGSARNLEYILSDFGTTEISIPQVIQDMRNPSAAEQTAIVDDKKYLA